MKLKLLSIALLSSCIAYGQEGDNAEEKKPVYVMLAPAGVDTGLEIRSSMRINVTHLEEGQLVGYRFKDQAFLMSCADEKKADAMLAKLKSRYQAAKLQKLHLDSYINEGFKEVKKGTGREDPSFPVYYETGDNPLDARSYRIEKLDWIANHPMPEDGSLPGTKKPTENNN
ncbi:MAG TPA: hypothetical protein VEB40_11965 [Flavipsychrobacter sp.]|nr:hypothetical protein [Flavipsychrobacter sp.]